MTAINFPLARPYGIGGGTSTIAGRIVVVDGRFANDAGFVGIHAISEFSLVHRCRIGDERDVVRRLDRAAAARRNAARVFMMAHNLFALSPRDSLYWPAVARVVALAAERGLYTELCLFPDAQHIMPNHADRVALVRDFAVFCLDHPSVIPQLTNEPGQNGFTGATDPKLLELARILADLYGSLDFSIGDPPDEVENEHTGEPLAGFLVKLAARSNVLVLHDERLEDPGRFARWVDHLKGLNDHRPWLRGKALWHDEPKGMAGVKDVPVEWHADGSVKKTYRREDRAEALVAATCVAAITQTGFTTHYISEQDDRIPGLMESAIAADIPQGPEWRFVNAVLPGSPVTGFSGFEKVRPCTNGREAWACAYVKDRPSPPTTISWDEGFVAERVFNGANVEVWRAER